MMRQVILSLALGVAAIYLFVSAPPPLPEETHGAAPLGQPIPTKVLLDAANLVNAAARKIYTERIVASGQEAGLAFNEDWQSSEIEAGPLPALFLRAVADELARMQSPLGLFLGFRPADRAVERLQGRAERLFRRRESRPGTSLFHPDHA